MSVRLNVVVVQSPQMSTLQVGVVAEIVVQLLGRPGIDLAMVTSLQSRDDQSTDQLMLSGLENDLAVIDWRSAEEIVVNLEEMGVAVARVPHRLDRDCPFATPSVRKLYAFDLRQGFNANEVVDAVTGLLAARNVMTIPLGIPGKTASGTSPTTKHENQVASPAASPAESTNIALQSRSIAEPVATAKLNSIAHEVHPSSNRDETFDDEEELDSLVDQLNEIDL